MSTSRLNGVVQQKWFWPAVAFGVLLFVTKGSILTAMGPVAKFLIPIAGIYLGYRLAKNIIKQKLVNSMQQAANQFEEQARRYQDINPQSTQQRPIIEICSKCGNEKSAGHSCA